MLLKDLLERNKREREKAAKRKAAKNVAIGAGVGTVLGLAAGLLFAPKSGKETRQDIAENAKKAADKVSKGTKKVVENVKHSMEDVKGKRKSGRWASPSFKKSSWFFIFFIIRSKENSRGKDCPIGPFDKDFSYCFILKSPLLWSLPCSIPRNLILLPDKNTTEIFLSASLFNTDASKVTFPTIITLLSGAIGTMPSLLS